MPKLPEHVHERLRTEFSQAAEKVASRSDIPGKVYYFSVFHGEAGRQLNLHWDPDLALLFLVVQNTCGSLSSSAQRPRFPTGGEFPPDGIPERVPSALDEVSRELALAFETQDPDLPRLYASLAKCAEIAYATTGNGLYLYLKGHLRL